MAYPITLDLFGSSCAIADGSPPQACVVDRGPVMPARPPLETSSLLRWGEVADLIPESPSLLLGNGASRAVWDGFSYESLFDLAVDAMGHRLTDADLSLFHEFESTDFETILGAVHTARRVLSAIGGPPRDLEERYISIQLALRDAIGESHVPWNRLTEEILAELRSNYRKFARIYTTNYDLLTYWAVMSVPPDGSDFVDFFWAGGNYYDPWDVEVWYSTATQIFFPHGAIHLRRTSDGRTRKQVSHGGEGLLAAFQVPFTSGETPLFVTEGAASEKERVIRSSDYLSFVLDEMSRDEQPLVVLGHGLGDQDLHVARAVATPVGRTVAVGMRQPGAQLKKLHYARVLPGADLLFFDSTTHPLTSPKLRVAA